MAQLHSTPPDLRALVHIVDADGATRQALEAWLSETGLKVRAHGSMHAFLATSRDEGPACLVVDVQQLAEGSDNQGPPPWPQAVRCPAVVIALRARVAEVVKAMKTGATDFVEKPLRECEIVPAILTAVETHRRQILESTHRSALQERFRRLTPRERQVMALVTAGRLNKQVGADLGLSEITVKAHRGSMMRKMSARSLAELVRMSDAIGDELARLRNERLTPTRSAAVADRHNGYMQAFSQ